MLFTSIAISGYCDSETTRWLLPRDIVTSFSCRFEGTTVFAATLYPAIAANPYLAFPWRVERSGTLEFRWEGDNGFAQTASAKITVE